MGTPTAGLTGGILLGSLVAVGINSHHSPAEVADYAWLIPSIMLTLWLQKDPFAPAYYVGGLAVRGMLLALVLVLVLVLVPMSGRGYAERKP